MYSYIVAIGKLLGTVENHQINLLRKDALRVLHFMVYLQTFQYGHTAEVLVWNEPDFCANRPAPCGQNGK